jgi:sugar lactone lactonase YvrE
VDRVSPSAPDGLTLHGVPAYGAEDVVVDEEGAAWTGTGDGSIWRVEESGSVQLRGSTGGRPLGLELLDDERLLVCDAVRGLLAMHRATGAIEVLATEAAGRPLLVTNNAAVGPAGEVWFSDSSAVHGLADWRADLVERTRSGRLLCRHPDGTVEERLGGLDFANGVALTPDAGAVLVAECGARTVRRLWLAGERAGSSELLLDDLPGYPDNISLGSDGLVWVSLASPRVALLERVRRSPVLLRRAVSALPHALQPDPVPSVHVQAYDVGPQGARLVHDVRRPAVRFDLVTGVREQAGRLWLASLENSCLAVLDTPVPASAPVV